MRPARRHRAASFGAAGMTIMEMMIVALIIALVMTGATLGMGSLTRQKLKTSSVNVAAAVRMAYSRAATKGHTVRIVFDIDARAFWAEEAEGGGRMLLNRDDDESEEDDEEGEAGEGGAAAEGIGAGAQADALAGLIGGESTDLLSAARSAAQTDLGDSMDFDMLGQLGAAGSAASPDMTKVPRYRQPRFTAVPGRLGRPRELEDGVSFASVYTSHRENPAEEGRAYLYFFTGGVTELAVIQVRDSDGVVNSVEVHPLTGRCRIHDVPYEAPTNDDDLNEAREAF